MFKLLNGTYLGDTQSHENIYDEWLSSHATFNEMDYGMLKEYATEYVCPYFHSTQRQLGKSKQRPAAKQCLLHLAYIGDFAATLARKLNSITAACVDSFRHLLPEEEEGNNWIEELLISLQHCYDDLIPMLCNSLSEWECYSARQLLYIKVVTRVQLLALFNQLVDKLMQKTEWSLYGTIMSNLINQTNLWQLHENTQDRWMVCVDLPLLVDYACLYHCQVAGEETENAELQFVHASLDHWCKDLPVSFESLDSVMGPAHQTGSSETCATVTAEGTAENIVDLVSLISNVQDLFPHLSDGYIEACLMHFDRDLDKTIAALCDPENCLPPEIRQLDPSNTTAKLLSSPTTEMAPSTIRPVHHSTAAALDERPSEDAWNKIKSNIRAKVGEWEQSAFETVGAFDEDNDDYDEEDELVDPWMSSAVIERPAAKSEAQLPESELFSAYQRQPNVFDRQMRQSKERQQLKQRTGMTDEQLEGWKVMLERNPNREEAIANAEIEQVRNRFNQLTPDNSSSESLNSAADRNKQGGRGRGGRGRGNRGGRGRGKQRH